MIRKLITERDNQQWMLDLALNMRGRVQNFERDDVEVPPGTRAWKCRSTTAPRFPACCTCCPTAARRRV